MRDFLWDSSTDKKKINWIDWERVNKPNKLGGLGIRNIKAINKALLSKWSWRYSQEKEAVCRLVIQYKTQTENDDLIPKYCKDSYGRGLWKEIENKKEGLHSNMEMNIGDGTKTNFWLDP